MWKRRRQPMNEEQFLQLCKTDFPAALRLNKLWRGDLIPHLPITKNIFCLNDKSYDIEKLKLNGNEASFEEVFSKQKKKNELGIIIMVTISTLVILYFAFKQ